MIRDSFDFLQLINIRKEELLWEDVSPWIYILLILGIIFIVFLIVLSIRAHKRAVTTGEIGLIGEIAVADTEINPEGKIFIKGEIWDSYADVKIRKGNKVRIVRVEGMKVYVEPLKDKEKS